FRKKKLTKTNVKELLEGKETLVKGIKMYDCFVSIQLNGF
ncbi:topoisomerase, partial [Streptococcus suis]